jgi:hypothetical protein
VREAIHLGTPVIATDNGMRPDGVELIEIGDEAGLVAKLAQITATEKHRTPPPTPDTSNIDAILNIYHDLA